MNLFEGARRLGFVLIGIVLVIGIGFAVTAEPYISIQYNVISPASKPFYEEHGTCDYPNEDAQEYKKSPKGHGYRLVLCFKTMQFDREHLIPYLIDQDGKFWGDSRYSSNVTSYINQVKNSFNSLEAGATVDGIYWDHFLKDLANNLGITLLVASALFLLMKVIGWVARGFMGIPSGQDSKAE